MKNTRPEIDNRQSKRFPLQLPVAVKTPKRRVNTATRNISAGGVLLDLESEVKVGAPMKFTICMPAKVLGSPKDVKVNCVGRVVRCQNEKRRRAVALVIDEYQFQRA